MNNIINVFRQDMKGLIKNVLAMIIAIGLCFLPCLYAWFNIYSNWDPYANTQNVPIAVASDDLGYQKSDGTYVNMGEQIIEKLKANEKLGWRFTESTQDAIDGVYSGEYYAAIIMDTDFSQSMYDCITNNMEHPKILYYENEKRNAIAVKITDSGSTSLQNTINEEFTQVVVTTISEHINDFSEDETGLVEEIETKIQNVYDNLTSYSALIDSFVECNTSMAESMDSFKALVPELMSALNSAAGALNSAASSLGNVQSGLATASAVSGDLVSKIGTLNSNLNAANTALLAAQTVIAQNGSKTDIVNNLNTVSNSLGSVVTQANSVYDDLTKYASQTDSAAVKTEIAQAQTKIVALRTAASTAQTLAKNNISTINALTGDNGILSEAATLALVNKAIGELGVALPTLANYNISAVTDAISSGLNQTTSGTRQTASNANAAVSSVTADEDLILALLDSAAQMMLTANDALSSSKVILDGTTGKMDNVLGQLNALTSDEKYQQFVELLESDPEALGSFLSQPINVETVPVYYTETYGSAVTPFYTTLALWVGAIILVALIKVRAVPTGTYRTATLDQLYFGRMIIFILLGQVQALMVAWGDLHLLHVQNTDKALFYLACCVTSFTFVLMIYTLTLSFGNIGKAFAVVIMIIQIAGSSGTYPIELLPDVFQRIYTYFPFPYAINMIRETISGRYENMYWTYMLELLIFAAASLVLGIWIRKPFMQWNQFIEKRMSDTKMM